MPLTKKHYRLYYFIHRSFWNKFQDFPNLVRCRDFNDKIQWLKLFDQNSETVRCIDKISVRDYVEEKIGKKYLVKLYQVRSSFSQIDFDALPNSFVIKANHDSGSVILVRDKSKFNYKSAKVKIEAALKRTYGWKSGQWGYALIKPKVLVEEFIDPQSCTPPPDYKFHCIDGAVRFVQYIYDRGSNTKEQILCSAGRDMSIEFDPKFKPGGDFTKPSCWQKMISAAEDLSSGFKYVRVDLFYANNKIIIGEMTFWPMGGYYRGNGQKKLSEFLDFDSNTFKPLVAST